MSEPMLPHVLNVLIAGRTTAATPEAIKAACASAGMIMHSDLNPNVDIVFSVDGDDRNGFVRMARELIQNGKPMLIQTLADLNRATADPADYFKRLGKVFVQARNRPAPAPLPKPPVPPALFMTEAFIPSRHSPFSMSL